MVREGIKITKTLDARRAYKLPEGMVSGSIVSAHVSHGGIISRAGGPAATGRAIEIDSNQVKSWKRNDSIPPGYWNRFIDKGLASFRELSDAAERRVEARGAA